MEKQHLTISQMINLENLGLNINDASLNCIETTDGKILFIPKNLNNDFEIGCIICNVFTLQDLINLLPNCFTNKDGVNSPLNITFNPIKQIWVLRYINDESNLKGESNIFIDAVYNLLCNYIESTPIQN